METSNSVCETRCNKLRTFRDWWEYTLEAGLEWLFIVISITGGLLALEAWSNLWAMDGNDEIISICARTINYPFYYTLILITAIPMIASPFVVSWPKWKNLAIGAMIPGMAVLYLNNVMMILFYKVHIIIHVLALCPLLLAGVYLIILSNSSNKYLRNYRNNYRASKIQQRSRVEFWDNRKQLLTTSQVRQFLQEKSLLLLYASHNLYDTGNKFTIGILGMIWPIIGSFFFFDIEAAGLGEVLLFYGIGIIFLAGFIFHCRKTFCHIRKIAVTLEGIRKFDSQARSILIPWGQAKLLRPGIDRHRLCIQNTADGTMMTITGDKVQLELLRMLTFGMKT